MATNLSSYTDINKKNRFSGFKQNVYYLKYGVDCFLLGKHKPIVAGVPLTDVCNLQCKHCVIANAGRGHNSLSQIEEWIRQLYKRGARILYIQGGEAFMWQEGQKRVNDVIALARRVGFFKVAMVTNGTYPIETDADAVWISIDGTPQRHNAIRGEGVFERVLENLHQSTHPNIRANMTVNAINYLDVEAVVKLVADQPKFRGVSMNFHTPYPGKESLFIPLEKRKQIITQILDLKEKGYPILNSKAGLKALQSGNYKRPVWMINLVEQGQIFECCWGRQYPKVCEKCGYGVIAELSMLSELKLGAIREAFKLF